MTVLDEVEFLVGWCEKVGVMGEVLADEDIMLDAEEGTLCAVVRRDVDADGDCTGGVVARAAPAARAATVLCDAMRWGARRLDAPLLSVPLGATVVYTIVSR